jgi:hypothetical protein
MRSLVLCIPDSILNLGETFGTFSLCLFNFERILGSNIGDVHGTCCSKSRIDLRKASLAHPS